METVSKPSSSPFETPEAEVEESINFDQSLQVTHIYFICLVLLLVIYNIIIYKKLEAIFHTEFAGAKRAEVSAS